MSASTLPETGRTAQGQFLSSSAVSPDPEFFPAPRSEVRSGALISCSLFRNKSFRIHNTASLLGFLS